MAISAVILTHNEEKNIAECLKTLSWCQEVLVIDDNSTDKTTEIAKKHGAVVINHSLANDFSNQRNFGLEKAKSEWILFIDADERISDVLQNEILSQVQDNNINGFFVKRQDSMWGKILKHGEQGNITLLRLGRKNSGKWVGKVHEVWKVSGSTEQLKNLLHHFPHPTLAEFLAEINLYSTLRAKELQERGEKAGWFSVVSHTKGKFLEDYLAKLGFLDGIEGFIVAMLMSFHAFLVRGKLWQLTTKN